MKFGFLSPIAFAIAIALMSFAIVSPLSAQPMKYPNIAASGDGHGVVLPAGRRYGDSYGYGRHRYGYDGYGYRHHRRHHYGYGGYGYSYRPYRYDYSYRPYRYRHRDYYGSYGYRPYYRHRHYYRSHDYRFGFGRDFYDDVYGGD